MSAGTASNSVGGLVGKNIGVISAGTASGTVNAGNSATSIGGLAGNNAGTVSGGLFTGTILADTAATSGTAATYVGGLVGYNSGSITGTGTVSGTISAGTNSQDVGGLVGYATGTASLITGGLVQAGAVLSPGAGATNVGGLVGYNAAGSTISGGTALEAVSGTSNVGGFVGYNAGVITGISAGNSVSGGASSTAVGGLVGYNTGTLTASSATGQVSVGASSFAIGGLAGFNATGGTVAGNAGTGGVTAGAGSTFVHGANVIGCDETAGCNGTAGVDVITVTASPVTTTYGTAGGALVYTPTGTLESGDSYGSILSGGLATNAGTAAGTYSITQGSVALTSSDASDYTIDYVGASYIITPASLTVSAAPESKVYGTSDPTLAYTATGLVNGDTSSVFTGGLSRAAGQNVGSYTIGENTLSAGGNYTITYIGNNLAITPASLTVSAAPESKVYGASDPALAYTASGLANGDTSAVFTGGLSRAAGQNVGSYAIGQNTLSAGGNYTITYTGNTLAITPASLTVTPTGTQTYGGTGIAVSYAYAGLTNGDGSGVVSGIGYSTPVTGASNVGTYGITATGGTAANYTITDAAGTYTVTPAPLTIAPTGSQTYGGTNVVVSYAYSGLVNGDTSGVVGGLGYYTNATSSSPVSGTYGIAALGGAASNYTVTDGTGAYTVNRAALTIAANDAGRLYGAPDPTFTATFTGLVLGQASSVVTGLGITANDPANAASGTSWTITPSGGTAANYAIIYQTGTLSVDKASLTLTPVSASRTYGSANPVFSYTEVGLQNGDTISGVTYATTATQGSNVGTYQLGIANAVAPDYTIVFDTGLLTITPAPLTITAGNAARQYGAANPQFTASYTGLVNGDGAAVVSGLTYATQATPGSNVGQYLLTVGGGSALNYALIYQSGILSVTPAPLTIAAGSITRQQGNPDPAFTASYSGLVNNDTPAVLTGLAFLAGDTANSPMGSYALTPYGANDPNYTISYIPGTITVTGSPVGSSSNLAQVVTNQISLAPQVTLPSISSLSVAAASPLQGLISTLASDTAPEPTSDSVSCLKSGGDPAGATCSGTLIIRGY